jgi:hypothetical protein
MNLRARLVPYLLLGILTLGTGLGIWLGLSEAPAATEQSPLTIQAHGTFGSCTTGIVDSVSINRGQLKPGESLIITMTAKNVGNADCQYGGGGGGGIASIGPCGTAPLVILNSTGKDVWPSGAGFCALTSTQTLHPGQTAHAKGRWNLTLANGTPAPPGKYTVDVALLIRFSIVVEEA